MRDQTLAPLVVFSHHSAHAASFPVTVRCAEGCYKGEVEPSFIADAAAFYASNLPAVLFADQQESILYLDNQRGAWLRYGPAYGEADQQYVGQWREITKDEATYLTGYTILNGHYYAAF